MNIDDADKEMAEGFGEALALTEEAVAEQQKQEPVTWIPMSVKPAGDGDCRKLCWIEDAIGMAYVGIRAWSAKYQWWTNSGTVVEEKITYWQDLPNSPLYAAPVAKAQDGMVTVPRDVISTLNESREELFKVSGSAFLAGEKCKKGDGYACYQLVCSANNGIAYALSLLDAAKSEADLYAGKLTKAERHRINAEQNFAATNEKLARLREMVKDAKDCTEAFTDPEDEMPEDTGEFRDLKRVLVLLRAELEKHDE